MAHQTLNEVTMINECLSAKLLKIGGARVAHLDPPWDQHIVRGHIREKQVMMKLKGQPHRCHRNSSGFWVANYPDLQLVTGYALSAGGIWLRHSWLEADTRLFETTVKAAVYFGVVLTDEPLLRFVVGDVLDCFPESDTYLQRR